MQNEILDFYEEHEISPVHADENDYLLRVKKRKNLYRQLGVPVQALKGSKVIEFGTGGDIMHFFYSKSLDVLT